MDAATKSLVVHHSDNMQAQADTLSVVRSVTRQATSAMVQRYIEDTQEWIESAESVAATTSEYRRVEDEFQTAVSIPVGRRRQLELTATRNSEFLVLKRHRVGEVNGPPKRLKLSAVDPDTYDELAEMTRGDEEYYTLAAGTLEKRTIQHGTISIKPDEPFDLTTMIPQNSGTKPAPPPSAMLSQPFRNSLMLKSQMTSLGQAFMARSKSSGSSKSASFSLEPAATNYYYGRVNRDSEALRQEYLFAARTIATILTRRVSRTNRSALVIMEPGFNPVVLRRTSETTHVSPDSGARVLFKAVAVKKDSDALSYTLSYCNKVLERTATTYKDFATFDIDAGGVVTDVTETAVTSSTLPTAPTAPTVYVFAVPPDGLTDGDSKHYTRLSLHNLYSLDTSVEDLCIALGENTGTQHYCLLNGKAFVRSGKSQVLVKGYSDASFVLDAVTGDTHKTAASPAGVHSPNTSARAYYSSSILEPCVEASARQHANGSAHIPGATVDNAIHFIQSGAAEPTESMSLERVFQEQCSMRCTEVADGKDVNWCLRLSPVRDEDVQWMGGANAGIPEFDFNRGAPMSANTYTWFLGGSPSPSLDALEGALGFLSSQSTMRTSVTNADKLMGATLSEIQGEFEARLKEVHDNLVIGGPSFDVDMQVCNVLKVVALTASVMWAQKNGCTAEKAKLQLTATPEWSVFLFWYIIYQDTWTSEEHLRSLLTGVACNSALKHVHADWRTVKVTNAIHIVAYVFKLAAEVGARPWLPLVFAVFPTDIVRAVVPIGCTFCLAVQKANQQNVTSSSTYTTAQWKARSDIVVAFTTDFATDGPREEFLAVARATMIATWVNAISTA